MKIRSKEVELTMGNFAQFAEVRGEAVAVGVNVTLQVFFENREAAGEAAIVFSDSPEVEVGISMGLLEKLYKEIPSFESDEMLRFLAKRRSGTSDPPVPRRARPQAQSSEHASSDESYEGSEAEVEPQKPGAVGRRVRRLQKVVGGSVGKTEKSEEVSSERTSLFEALLDTIGVRTLLPVALPPPLFQTESPLF